MKIKKDIVNDEQMLMAVKEAIENWYDLHWQQFSGKGVEESVKASVVHYLAKYYHVTQE